MDDKPVTRIEMLDALAEVPTRTELQATFAALRSEIQDTFATKTEMREEFAALRSEIHETFATKAEMRDAFATMRSEMQETFVSMQSGLREDLASARVEMRETIVESVRDSQTELLKAFLSYQENNDLRLRTGEAKLSNVDTGLSQRVHNVERRLWEIEKKILLNPPAA